MSRAKQAKKLIGEELLEISPEEKRFATPEAVSLYRAERLACNTIVDLCAGAGFQSFGFSKKCAHVLAVDKEKKLIAQGKKYAQKLGLSNITFLCSDVLSSDILKEIKKQKPDIIFCDPERYAAEAHRNLATMQPDIQKLLAEYHKITQNLAIEFPPHIAGLDFDAEYEYLSLDGALNRLTLYFGTLKKAGKSVVLLPENIRIQAAVAEPFFALPFPTTEITEGYSYLLEPNPALVLSGLFKEAFAFSLGAEAAEPLILAKEIVQIIHGKKIFFLSTKKIENPFFHCYHIIERISPDDKNRIALQLQELGAAKVVLRYTLDPKEYWKERSFFERQLTPGEKTIHLFVFDTALVCEKMEKG